MQVFAFLRQRKILVGVILLGVVAVGGGYSYASSKPQEILTYTAPIQGPLEKQLEISGSLTAKEYAKMSFAAGGKLTYVGAHKGEVISKGHTIAKIDQRSLQKNLEKSLQAYSKERLDWDQTLDNSKDRTLPATEQRTNAKNQIDLNTTVLDVQLSTIAITNAILTAPFDGVLISAPTEITGVNLAATDTYELVNPDTLVFQALVDETDIDEVRVGQPATITLDAYPDAPITTTISYISYKSAQTSTGTVFLVEFPIPLRDIERYRIGLNGDAMITTQYIGDTLSIPLDATTQRDGKTYVKKKTSTAEPVEVEIATGVETDDRIEVVSGLTPSDEIVLPTIE